MGQIEDIVESVRHHAKITGFCLEQASTLLIVIECDQDLLPIFMEKVADYADEEAGGDARLKNVRVVASVEDAAKQYFPPFRALSLSLVKEKDVDLEQEYGDITSAGTSVHLNLMKIGHTIKKTMSEEDPKD